MSNAKPEALLGPTFRVKLTEIDPSDPPHEPRVTIEEIDELAAGMKETGRASDTIKLRKHPTEGGPYAWARLAGKRRILAARKLGWEELDAQEYLGSDEQAAFYAAGDNLGRKAHTTFETARYLSELSGAFKYKPAALTAQLKAHGYGAQFSEKYVDNLIRAHKKLAPVLLDLWSKQSPLLTTDLINWLVSMEPAAQMEIWTRVAMGENWRDIKERMAQKGPSEIKVKQGSRILAKPIDVEAASKAIKLSPLGSVAQEAALAVLAWIMSPRTTPLKIGQFNWRAPEANTIRQWRVIATRSGKGQKPHTYLANDREAQARSGYATAIKSEAYVVVSLFAPDGVRKEHWQSKGAQPDLFSKGKYPTAPELRELYKAKPKARPVSKAAQRTIDRVKGRAKGKGRN